MSLEGFFGESVDLMVLLFLLVASGTPLIRKEKQILDHRLLFLERNGSHAATSDYSVEGGDGYI
jgi:hypothetical protein